MSKKWRCFFCDEVFSNHDAAAQHFGVFEACEADLVACKLMQHQTKVVSYIRDLENQVRSLQAQAHEESHPLLSALYDIQHETEARVKNAEEKGYLKGVQDMTKQGHCPEPQKHI